MAESYSIESTDGVTTVRFLKAPDPDDFYTAMDEVARDHSSELRLWDLSCGLELSSAEVRRVAEYGKSKFSTPSRVAIVAPTDLAFGLARMEDVYRQDDIVVQKVFRTELEARAWLQGRSPIRLPLETSFDTGSQSVAVGAGISDGATKPEQPIHQRAKAVRNAGGQSVVGLRRLRTRARVSFRAAYMASFAAWHAVRVDGVRLPAWRWSPWLGSQSS